MIDMAMLIAEIKPDAEGNVIPPSIQEGSAQFYSAKGRHEEITIVIASGIYNIFTATCGFGCTTCCGDSNFGISPNPIYCHIGQTMPCSSTAVDCNGYSVSPSSWSSSNTAVMTVSSLGVVTGVSVGSATITATYSNVVMLTGQICGGNPCPRSSPAPQCPANTTPRIDGITPAQGLIGTTLPVTISGQGFGTNPSVQTGTGIAVTITNARDNQIIASFAIAPNAAGGAYLVFVTVTASDGTTHDSNAVGFYVQVPTSLSIVTVSDSTTTEAPCTTSGGLAGCGVTRTFKYQVNDQRGQPITAGGMQFGDVICNTSTNQLNLQGYTTTCGGMTGSCWGTAGPCTKSTDASGQFLETLTVCAPACKPAGTCTTAGQTLANQTWTIAGAQLTSDVKSISYQCNKILVNGK